MPGITVVRSNAHLQRVTLQDNVLDGQPRGAQLICDNATTMYVEDATFETAPGDDTPDMYGDPRSTCIVNMRTRSLDLARGGKSVGRRNARTNLQELQLLTDQDETYLQILRVCDFAGTLAPANNTMYIHY